jgi:hypothetical protein
MNLKFLGNDDKILAEDPNLPQMMMRAPLLQ